MDSLKREIFSRSEEKEDWKEACSEWKLVEVVTTNGAECICTHKITYVHWISNKINGNKTHVGSTCIEQFEGNTELIQESAQAEEDLKRKENGSKSIRPCIVCGRRTKKLMSGDFIHVKCKRTRRKDVEWQSNREEMNVALGQIRDHIPQLSPYEQQFVKDMNAKQKDKGASEKQLKWLKKLAERVKSQ